MKKVIVLVCMLCLAVPMFANSREDLEAYLWQESETVNAQTSLKKLTYLTLAAPYTFDNTFSDDYLVLITLLMEPENRTIKEKSALYSIMKFSDPEKQELTRRTLFWNGEPVELTNKDVELKELTETMGDFMHYLTSKTTPGNPEKAATVLSFLQGTN